QLRAKRDVVAGVATYAHLRQTVLGQRVRQHVQHVRAAGRYRTVELRPRGAGARLSLLLHRRRPAEVERGDRAGLHAERRLPHRQAVAAHGALRGLAGDVAPGDHVPGAGFDAVLAADADRRVDDDRALLVLGDRLHGADGGTHGVLAVHAA